MDAVSDDGEVALVLIALVGNPFSPAYARARARGPAVATSYASMNVALYSRRESWFSLRERALSAQHRQPDGVAIGGSTMRWEGGSLVADIDETTTPFGRRVRGRLVLRPDGAAGARAVALDRAGHHRWWPVAPLARVEVELEEPRLRFRGHGYHDANAGMVPLEATFDTWSWARARTSRGAVVTYDVREKDGFERSLATRIGPNGDAAPVAAPYESPLPRTLWGIRRHARTDRSDAAPILGRALEDGPFYARALVHTSLDGERVTAMHEVLSASRLAQSWVRFLTGFRIGRAGAA